MEPLTRPRPASPPPQGRTPQDRVLWTGLAALAGILPAAGIAYAGRSVMHVIQAIATVGGGIGAVSMGLYESNRPLIVAVIAATLLAAAVAIALFSKPGRSGSTPGILLSALVPVAACVPALLLWSAEAFIIDLVGGRVSTPVALIAEASARLANLLTSSFLLSLVLGGLLVVVSIVSLARSRPRPAAAPRVHGALWVVTTLLLAAMAVSFYMRSSYLHEVAMRGSL